MNTHDNVTASLPIIKVINHFFGFTVVGNIITALLGVVVFFTTGFDFDIKELFVDFDFITMTSVGVGLLIKIFSLAMTYYGFINGRLAHKINKNKLKQQKEEEESE